MATVKVDATSQRYTSAAQPEPDVLLLHTTEGMSWPGYYGGSMAPHDTVRPIPGVGIEVRRHYPYDQFSKSLENRAGGVQTNKRGVIQVELRGTCDPKYRNNSAWYFWPDADDAVLEALADYYRPIMAQYGIPAEAMGRFVAYPASYGTNASQRLSFSQWQTRQGICGHQHAPENVHGDPGAFPIERFIAFLTKTPTQQEDAMSAQDVKAINDYTAALLLNGYTVGGVKKPSLLAVLVETQARVSRTESALSALATGLGPQVEAAVREALSAEYDAKVELSPKTPGPVA